MNKRLVVITLSLVLCLAVWTAGPHASDPSPGPVPEPIGGRDYFFCAAFQLLKYGGLVTLNPHATLIGAIGGGISCVFGW